MTSIRIIDVALQQNTARIFEPTFSIYITVCEAVQLLNKTCIRAIQTWRTATFSLGARSTSCARTAPQLRSDPRTSTTAFVPRQHYGSRLENDLRIKKFLDAIRKIDSTLTAKSLLRSGDGRKRRGYDFRVHGLFAEHGLDVGVLRPWLGDLRADRAYDLGRVAIGGMADEPGRFM